MTRYLAFAIGFALVSPAHVLADKFDDARNGLKGCIGNSPVTFDTDFSVTILDGGGAGRVLDFYFEGGNLASHLPNNDCPLGDPIVRTHLTLKSVTSGAIETNFINIHGRSDTPFRIGGENTGNSVRISFNMCANPENERLVKETIVESGVRFGGLMFGTLQFFSVHSYPTIDQQVTVNGYQAPPHGGGAWVSSLVGEFVSLNFERAGERNKLSVSRNGLTNCLDQYASDLANGLDCRMLKRFDTLTNAAERSCD